MRISQPLCCNRCWKNGLAKSAHCSLSFQTLCFVQHLAPIWTVCAHLPLCFFPIKIMAPTAGCWERTKLTTTVWGLSHTALIIMYTHWTHVQLPSLSWQTIQSMLFYHVLDFFYCLTFKLICYMEIRLYRFKSSSPFKMCFDIQLSSARLRINHCMRMRPVLSCNNTRLLVEQNVILMVCFIYVWMFYSTYKLYDLIKMSTFWIESTYMWCWCKDFVGSRKWCHTDVWFLHIKSGD